MKKILIVLLSLCVVFSLCGCDSAKTSQPEEIIEATVEEISDTNTDEETVEETVESIEPEEEPAEVEEPAAVTKASDEKVLVAYFSATGNTKKVAEMIAEYENADLYEIVPAEIYTADDLNYSNNKSRSIVEQADASSRPEIASETVDISEYTKIYVGYPIWCAIEPRIMDTFVEAYDFSDKTVIPFCTSGSSGIGKSGTNLEKLAGTGTWFEGKRFPGSVSEEKIKEWIDCIE